MTEEEYGQHYEANSEKEAAYDKLLKDILEIVGEANNDNANVGSNASAKMLQIAERASKEAYLSKLIPEKFMKLHREGYVRFHDLGWLGTTFNCLQIPLGKILRQGFNNGRGFIRPPQRISSAAELFCIILQSAQNDCFGGQSVVALDRDLAPYAEEATDREIEQAMQGIVYNLNSLASRAGAQCPFSSVHTGLDTSEGGRKVTKFFLQEYEKGLGKGEAPKFPNLLFQIKEGVNTKEGDPNYDLFQLACRVASKRLFPSFVNCSASFNKDYPVVAYMG